MAYLTFQTSVALAPPPPAVGVAAQAGASPAQPPSPGLHAPHRPLPKAVHAPSRRPSPKPSPIAAPHAPPSAPPFAPAPTVSPSDAAPLQDDTSDIPGLPHYPTQLPPAQTMHFRVTRGDAVAQGSLRWAHDAGRYNVALHSEGSTTPQPTSGATILATDWRSEGSADARGLAPQRMAVHQRGRTAHAANFQQERGVATFSGPSTQQALAAQSQDRLSWLLQLPAIAQAQPERMVAGHVVHLHVVGARGDAAVWAFEVHGLEPVDLGDGHEAIVALKLTRQAKRAYDTNVTLWLDPARHHLPLRWRWQAHGSTQPATEWLRVD